LYDWAGSARVRLAREKGPHCLRFETDVLSDPNMGQTIGGRNRT
jgi:hypothetical protein